MGMYDAEEFMNYDDPSISSKRYIAHGYRNAQAIVKDLHKAALIIQNEYPKGSEERDFADSVIDNLYIMKWIPL